MVNWRGWTDVHSLSPATLKVTGLWTSHSSHIDVHWIIEGRDVHIHWRWPPPERLPGGPGPKRPRGKVRFSSLGEETFESYFVSANSFHNVVAIIKKKKKKSAKTKNFQGLNTFFFFNYAKMVSLAFIVSDSSYQAGEFAQ
jgi:hypothetical protein